MADHLEFALKHEGVNLPLLWHLFRKVDAREILAFIRRTPGGKYSRKAGFLFEFLTGQTFDLDVTLGGNYEPLLDPEMYFCASNQPNRRWRVHNNLLGTATFCPFIQKTAELSEQLQWTPTASLEHLRAEYDAGFFSRATDWLYVMETGSSNEIEAEHPSPKRTERFVQMLRNAGQRPLAQALAYDALFDLQVALIDPKGRVIPGLRTMQTYIGADLGNAQVSVAYPCPPPQLAGELLAALPIAGERCEGLPTLLRAAVLKFGFVYIHPFIDGNGRISRYLIQDTYVRDGFTPSGFIFPVSAVIVKQLKEYTVALDQWSKPVRELADYDFDPMTHEMRLHNAAELEPLFRYPDFTAQTLYLAQVTHECADVVLVQELDYLDRMEHAKKALRETLDLEDRRLNLLLAIIHQNNGKVSANKRRSEFLDLDDNEIAEAERCYATAFQTGTRVALPGDI
jgi:hypothetical protein